MHSRRLAAWLLLAPLALQAQPLPASWALEDPQLAAYFAAAVGRLEARCLADVQTRSDWEAVRPRRHQQLLDMLGLWPPPARTDLQAEVSGRVDGGDLLVESLRFQSLPGLYVTANLYLPKGLSAPAPAILYVCGHSPVKTNGISFGNKVAYQHHGIWLAQQGYVCLMVDTHQLGEIEGDHHGTYRLGQWWWNSRGYTPAGVEAWNGIRALDYLESRPEVDPGRIGMTGRSGGGAYTWTVAALDERVRVAAPVAGITDLRNQVVDGAVEGHCDCMFYLNRHQWDFPLQAALVAPRPLLIVNTDADTLFPLDGVQRLFSATRRLYRLLGAEDELGLVIAPGPHVDTQDLQVPVVRWFDRHLKGATTPVTNAALARYPGHTLRALGTAPADARNSRIQREFGPPTNPPPADLEALRLILRDRCFLGWPGADEPLGLRELSSETNGTVRLRVFEFQSQPHVVLRLVVADQPGTPPQWSRFVVLDDAGWDSWMGAWAPRFPGAAGRLAGNPAQASAGVVPVWTGPAPGEVLFAMAPRGEGPHRWTGDARKQTQIRRRFPLVGQTLDGMRVWDIGRGLEAARRLGSGSEVILTARGRSAVNAALAAVFEDPTPMLDLQELPDRLEDEPDHLGRATVTDTANLLRLLEDGRAQQAERGSTGTGGPR